MKQFTPDGRTRRYTRNLFCAEARWPMYRTYHVGHKIFMKQLSKTKGKAQGLILGKLGIIPRRQPTMILIIPLVGEWLAGKSSLISFVGS